MDIEKLVIGDYRVMGIEDLCKKYKKGKKTIKKILTDNNVPLRKKGDFIKGRIVETDFKIELDNKIVSCDVCKKEFSDVENKSGTLTNHMKECYPDVTVPSKLFRSNYKKTEGTLWHLQFYSLKDKPTPKEVFKCPECEWETADLVNKTGWFTTHVNDVHGGVDTFIERNPTYKSYFNVHNLKQKRKDELNEEGGSVTCKLCGEKFKLITESHLQTAHGISKQEYLLQHPNERTVAKTVSERLSKSSIETNKNMKHTFTSAGEKELREFIESLGFKTLKGSNRKVLIGKEIDIVVEGTDICFEYDGLYWHTERMGKDKNYHLNKTKDAAEKGYKLYHIFEDEWQTKGDIVKSKIKNILNVNNCRKIGAREVEIITINTKTKSVFLDANHLQGNDKSTIHYGAYYREELVGVMTFNGKRNMTKTTVGQYELSRFAVKKDIRVNGLGSKIFKRFLFDYVPETVVSFADRRWTISADKNMYISMGFVLDTIVPPNYWYYKCSFNKYARLHKFGFGKNNIKKRFPDIDYNLSEKEIMEGLGFDRIWDCGLYRFIYYNKKTSH